MSKVFYDRLIIFEEVENEIKSFTETEEEKLELWQIVDETIHAKALETILDKLPRKDHEEFLDKFHKAPYDESLFLYLQEKIGKNIEDLLKQELGNLAFEILKEIKGKKK